VDETDLILNTYGNDDGANYATSITRFTQDSLYGSTLANKLLDLLTNGEHSKTMETLIEAEEVKQNQIEVDKLLPNYQKEAKILESVSIDFDELKTLKEIGVETDFLNAFEKVIKNGDKIGDTQSQLDTTSSLIEQLNQVQHDRLSTPLPQHLSLIAHPNKQEIELADQITSNITNIAKKLPPSAISSVVGVRKAMGMNVANFPPENALRMSKFSNRPIDVDATEVDMELEPPVATSEFDHEIRKLLGTE
jgi:bromodomain-containing protein 7/9